MIKIYGLFRPASDYTFWFIMLNCDVELLSSMRFRAVFEYLADLCPMGFRAWMLDDVPGVAIENIVRRVECIVLIFGPKCWH